MKAVCQRVLQRMLQRKLSACFRAWDANAREQIRMRVISQRVVKRLLQRKVSCCFASWADTVVEIKRLRTMGMRVMQRMLRRQLSTSFVRWHEAAGERVRMRNLCKRVMARRQNAELVCAMRQWDAFVAQRHEDRGIIKRWLATILNREIFAAMTTWKHFTRWQIEAEQDGTKMDGLERRVLGCIKLRNFHQLHKCLSQWHVLTVRKLRHKQKLRTERGTTEAEARSAERLTESRIRGGGEDVSLENIVDMLGRMIVRDLMRDKHLAESRGKKQTVATEKGSFGGNGVSMAWDSPSSSVSPHYKSMPRRSRSPTPRYASSGRGDAMMPQSPRRRSPEYSHFSMRAPPRPATAPAGQMLHRGRITMTGMSNNTRRRRSKRKTSVGGRPVLSAGPYKPTSDPELVPVPRDVARSPVKPFVGGTGTHSHSKVVAEQKKFRERVKYTPRKMNPRSGGAPEDKGALVREQLAAFIDAIKQQFAGD
jgi:hypothetical protein